MFWKKESWFKPNFFFILGGRVWSESRSKVPYQMDCSWSSQLQQILNKIGRMVFRHSSNRISNLRKNSVSRWVCRLHHLTLINRWRKTVLERFYPMWFYPVTSIRLCWCKYSKVWKTKTYKNNPKCRNLSEDLYDHGKPIPSGFSTFLIFVVRYFFVCRRKSF